MIDDALLGLVIAFVIAAALTPLVARGARRIGAVDQPRARGLGERPTPLLGGLGMFAGVVVAGLLLLPDTSRYHAILGGAAIVTAVGALDDWRPLPPAWKLAGELLAALVLVLGGVSVDAFTVPFAGRVSLGELGDPVTLLGLVAVMNAVNFIDGVDGLAAGVCAIASAAFAIIAFSRGRDGAGALALIACGASLGFLIHNFHPARVFMGDCGALQLGLLLGATIVEGTLKTNAVIALAVPLVVLAVPVLDTTFVVLKRMKYRRPVYAADANHLHHRFARIGFSQRRTVGYLYAWTATMAGLAVALRYIPYSDDHGSFNTGWSLVMGGCIVVAAAASVFVVYTLEILKFKRFRMGEAEPGTEEHEIEQQIEQAMETGEFGSLQP